MNIWGFEPHNNIQEHPELTKNDIKAVLSYASEREHSLITAGHEITLGSKHFAQVA